MDTGGTSTMRRWVLLTLALALTTIGIVVPSTLTQAIRNATPPGSQENPNFSASCGTDVVIILDESGSIESENAIGEVESAVRALVNGLNGTGSRVRIVEFSNNARDAIIGGSTAFQTVDNAFVAANGPLNTYLNPTTGTSQTATSYNPNQGTGSQYYTNWEAALHEAARPVQDSGVGSPPADGTPLIVFITDGGPNTTGTSGTVGNPAGATAQGTQAAADAAIQEMERLQLAGSHVLSIGVGQASGGGTTGDLLFNRLGNLTEPEAAQRQSWPTTPATNLDLRTVDIIDAGPLGGGTLESALKQVVAELCGSSLTINKTNDLGAPIAGRNFTLTVQSLSGAGGTQFEWQPPLAGLANTGQASATKTLPTLADGFANFKWTPGSLASPQARNSTVIFTETLPTGWGIDLTKVTCTVGGVLVQNLQKSVNVQTGVVSVGPFEIGRTQAAACNINNIPPATVTITKAATPQDGTDFTFNTTSPDAAAVKLPASFVLDVDGNDDNPNTRTYTVTPGAYTVTELATQQQGDTVWELENLTCTFAAQRQGSSATVDTQTPRTANLNLNPDDKVTCTFTNAQVPVPAITVDKTASPISFPEPAGTSTYTVKVTNTGTIPVTLTDLVDETKLRTQATWIERDLAVTLPTPVAEVGGAFTANTCDDLLASNPPIAANGGSVECTFTVAYTGRDAGEFIDDIVTATATDIYGRTASDDDDAAVEVTDVAPTVVVTKSNAGATSVVAPGGATRWTITVQNPPTAIEPIWIRSFADQMQVDPAGAAGLTNFGGPLDITAVGGPVTETNCGSLINQELAIGATATCEVTINTVTAGGNLATGDQLHNRVTVTAEDDEGTDATDTDSANRPVVAAPPVLDVWKTDGGASIPESGANITYHVWIDNIGQAGISEPLTVTRIVDQIWFPASNPATDPADATITIVQGADPVVTHNLPAGMFVATTCADPSVLGVTLQPATGMTEMQTVGSDSARARPTNADARTQCTITLHLDGDSGEVFNDLVTVTALDPQQQEVIKDNSADTPVVGAPPVVRIVKTANPTTLPEPGGQVTFTFVITNDSNEFDPITITGLSDTDFGNLLADRTDSNCDTAFDGLSIAPGASAQCTLTVTFTGMDAGDIHENTVTVSAVDDENTAAVPDTDDATVTFTDVLPTISVVKTAIAVDGVTVTTPPATVSENGGNVTYRVDVTNTSQEPVTLTVLNDDVFGPLHNQGTCAVSGVIQPGATYRCEFTRFVARPDGPNAPTSHVNVVTATAVDDEQNPASGSDPETVNYLTVEPAVTITKTDNLARVFEPGGDVVYTITITNPADAPEDLVAITSLIDTIDYVDREVDVVVDLLGAPVGDLKANDCPAAIAAALPLAPGDDPIECSFTITLSGTVQEVSDTVTVIAVDDDGDDATSSASELTPIDIVPVHDVGIVKTASGVPGGTLSNGEQFTYTLTVTNNGNVAATNVVVTDNVPARLRVDAVSVPDGWTNLSSGNSVSLSVPELAPSASVDVVLTVTLLPAAVPAPIEIQDGQPAPQLPDLAIETILNEACVDADVDTVPGNDCSIETVPVDDIVAVVYVRCVNDAPLLGYAVETTPSLAGEPITLTWRPNNPTAQTSPQEVVLTLASGDADEITWPGAVFTSGRVSIDWPGWRPIEETDYVNGSLSHHDPENVHNGMILDTNEPDYAWRELTTVSFEVNPAITFTAGYPDSTPDCVPQRSSALDIQKTSSVASIDAGQSFSYTIDVTNVSADGAAEPVVLTDQIPLQIRVDQIVTSTTAFPRWTNCSITPLEEGYGGQLRCDLFGALLMGASAPQVRLEVTARPTASGAVTNTAVVSWQLADVPDSPLLFVDDAATVTVNAVSVQPPAPSAPVLPPTGSSSTQPLIGLALLALLGGATILFVSRRRNQPPMSG